MTDLALDSDGDILIVDGEIPLLRTKQELVAQRLTIALGTISGELFTDLNFGIPREFLFAKGTEGLLSGAIRETIVNTDGVVQILSFESSLDKAERHITVSFTVSTESGDIVSLSGIKVT